MADSSSLSARLRPSGTKRWLRSISSLSRWRRRASSRAVTRSATTASTSAGVGSGRSCMSMPKRLAMRSRSIFSRSLTNEMATPGRARAPCSSGAMDVALGILRRFVLDHVGEIRDVEAARGHIGCHQETQLPLAHPFQHPLPVLLRQIGAQLVGVVAEALQHHRHIMHFDLGVAENDGGSRILNLNQPNESRDLSPCPAQGKRRAPCRSRAHDRG